MFNKKVKGQIQVYKNLNNLKSGICKICLFLTNKSYIGTDLVVFINFWYYQELSSFVYRITS